MSVLSFRPVWLLVLALVLAVFPADLSAASPSSALDVAPAAPENVQVGPVENGNEVEISWSPPLSNGGSPVTGYRLTRTNLAAPGMPFKQFIHAPATFVVWTDLVRGATYSFSVRAENAEDLGPVVTRSFSVPATEPTGFVVDPAGNGRSAKLSWGLPAGSDGSDVDHYVVTRTNPGNSQNPIVSVDVVGTTHTFAFLQPGVEYTFSVAAVKGDVVGDRVTRTVAMPVVAPGEPTTVDVVAAADGRSARISWEKPDLDGGSDIRGYVVTRTIPGSGAVVSDQVGGDVRTYGWTGLTPGELYTFTVAAMNENDLLGQAVSVTKPMPADQTAPGKPTSFVVDPGADGKSAEVSWDLPAGSDGSDIREYVVTRTIPGSRALVSDQVGANRTAYTWTGLVPGEEYTFTVAARNVGGALGAAATVTERMPADQTAPGQPTSFVVDPAGNGRSAKLSWGLPAGSDGSDVDHYVVTRTNPGNSQNPIVSVDVVGTTHTFAFLQPGVEYTFSVAAVKGDVVGDRVTRTVAMPVVAPGEPTTVDVVAAADGRSARISWEKPDLDGGSDIRGYVVTRTIPGSGAVVSDQVGGDVRTYGWTGLTPGELYTFTVAAMNENDLLGQAVSVTKPMPADQTAPGKPTSFVVDPGADGKSAEVSWDLPAGSDGSDIREYVVTRTIPGSRALVSDQVGANRTAYTWTGLVPGEEYTFTVAARNVGGALGAAATVTERMPADQTAPGQPTSFVVDPAGNGRSAKLSWGLPAGSDGSDVDHYVVTRTNPGNSQNPIVSVDVVGTTHTFAFLQPGVEYTFSVAAVKGDVVGDRVTRTVAMPVVAPGEPTTVDVVAAADGRSARISWEKPDLDGGSDIRGYVVTRTIPGSGAVVSDQVGGDVRTYGWTGLTPGELYTFTVAAMNENDLLGQAVSVTKPMPADQTAPGKPTSFVVDPGADGKSAEVSWDLPAGSDGSDIREYVVTRTIPGSRALVSDQVGANRTAYTWTGLVPGEEYTFTVAARNVGGALGAAATVTERMPADQTAPGQPTSFVVDPAGNGRSAKLSWGLPAGSDGSDVDHYVVTRTNPGNSQNPIVSVDVVGTTHTFAFLQPGVEYTFSVAAVKGDVVGDRVTRTVAMPVVAPGEPTTVDVVAAADGRSARISWEKPDLDGGSDIRGYVVTRTIPGSGAVVSDQVGGDVRTYGWTGLTPGELYTFTVAAMNENDLLGQAVSVTKPMPADQTAPGKPTSFVVDPGADGKSAEVSWDLPAGSDGSDIREYVVTRTIPGSRALVSDQVGANRTAYTWTGLVPGEEYTFTVAARNVGGALGAAATVTERMPADQTAPGQPTSFVVDPAGNGRSAKLSWGLPAGSDGSDVDHYVVTRTNPGNSQNPIVSVDVVGTTHTFAFLQPGVEYTFSVAAVKGDVVGDRVTRTVAMPVVAPGEPTTVDVVAAADGRSARISWEKPDLDGGSDISGYVVTRTDPAIPEGVITVPVGASAREHVWEGLTPATRYTFTVAAVNSAGASLAAAVTKTMPVNQSVPGVPTAFRADAAADGRSAKLVWAPPVSSGTGGPVTGYAVTRTDPADPNVVVLRDLVGPGHVWTGLTPGATYTFTVAARNASGSGVTASQTVKMPLVAPVVTTTSLSMTSPAPRVLQVTARIKGSSTPTGTVRFADSRSGVVLGAAPVVGGIASVTVSKLTPGSRRVTALYIPTPGSAFVASEAVALTKVKARSRLRELFPAKVKKAATSVRAVVRVRYAGLGVKPTGKVLIKEGKRVVGRGRLVAGKVRIRLREAKVGAGRSTLTLVYAGDGNGFGAKKKFRIVFVK